MATREKFSSRLGFILVSAGCAIGLGNVWKFPYICAEYGGAAFIVIYLLFLLILGLPILCCEFAVGRASRMGIARAYDTLEPKGGRWHHFRWPDLIANIMLMMFYTMVGGWMLYYAWQYITGGIIDMNKTEVQTDFNNMLSSPSTLTIWMIVALAIAIAICILGLKNGVERISKVMMSVLIVLIVVLAVHSLVLKGAGAGIKYYLVPDFKNMVKKGLGKVIFAAMTHAFFTLSIGIGSMEIFGSYMQRKNSIVKESATVVCLDTFVALMAGFIIIPACFAFGVTPDAGPSLLFITLPNVFNNMAGGRIWGAAFFIFMSFAALSTIVAVVENIIAFFMDMWQWKRVKATLITAAGLAVLSMPAVLGFNVLSSFEPLGAGTGIMDLEDFLVSYNLLPLGSLVFVLFCTHRNGWGWNGFRSEVNEGTGIKLPNNLKFYMSYILPLIIVAVYLKGYYDTFSPKGTATLIGWMAFAVVLLAAISFLTLTNSKPKKSNV